ncbi:MAG: hypothetical protein HQL53_00320 [Magnetococcales bacterium]|nr:hypothetical protein [Magnetococcales bacterium]
MNQPTHILVNVTIRLEGDTYRVPAPEGSEENAYYTKDRDDAFNTGHALWADGGFAKVCFHILRVDPNGTSFFPKDNG